MDDRARLKALQDVIDRAAITDLIYRFCRAMDRMDAELGYSVWHADSWADYGAGFYQGSGHGYVDWANRLHSAMTAHQHSVGNIVLEIRGNDAASESSFHANLRKVIGGQPKHIATWGRYIDHWSRRDGIWGLDRRQSVIDLDEIRDVTAFLPPAADSRNRADPSYAALGDYGRPLR